MKKEENNNKDNQQHKYDQFQFHFVIQNRTKIYQKTLKSMCANKISTINCFRFSFDEIL